MYDLTWSNESKPRYLVKSKILRTKSTKICYDKIKLVFYLFKLYLLSLKKQHAQLLIPTFYSYCSGLKVSIDNEYLKKKTNTIFLMQQPYVWCVLADEKCQNLFVK